MAYIDTDIIKVIAQTAGIFNLSDEAAQTLGPEGEYRLREIIQEADKFRRHAKRTVLTQQDLQLAFQQRSIQPPFALSTKDPNRFLRAAGFPDVYFHQDPVFQVDQLINNLENELQKGPSDVDFRVHWLAVQGVQPQIPENYNNTNNFNNVNQMFNQQQIETQSSPEKGDASRPSSGKKSWNTSRPASAGQFMDPNQPQIKGPVMHALSQEMQLYLKHILDILVAQPSELFFEVKNISNSQNSEKNGEQYQQFAQIEETQEKQEMRKFVNKFKQLIQSLESDAGMHRLVPYIIKQITEGAKECLKCFPRYYVTLHALRALMRNQNVHLQPYLHQIMPIIMTGLISKRLGRKNTDVGHWRMRDAAAEVLSEVCTKYACIVQIEQQAITMLIKNGFNLQGRSLQTLYGVIQGFRKLGFQQVRKWLIPNCFSIVQDLNIDMEQRNDLFRQKDAYVVFDVLLKAVGEAIADLIQQEKNLNQNQLVKKKMSKLKVFENVDGFFSKRKISKENNNEKTCLGDAPDLKRTKTSNVKDDNIDGNKNSYNNIDNNQINKNNNNGDENEKQQVQGDSLEITESLSKVTDQTEEETADQENKDHKIENNEINAEKQSEIQETDNTTTQDKKQQEQQQQQQSSLENQEKTQKNNDNVQNTDLVQELTQKSNDNAKNIDQVEVSKKNLDVFQQNDEMEVDIDDEIQQGDQMDTGAGIRIISSQINENQGEKVKSKTYKDVDEIGQLQLLSMLADDASLDDKILALQILFGERFLQYVAGEYVVGG